MLRGVANLLVNLAMFVFAICGTYAADDGSVLPFPPTPMQGDAPPRLQDATMQWPSPP